MASQPELPVALTRAIRMAVTSSNLDIVASANHDEMVSLRKLLTVINATSWNNPHESRTLPEFPDLMNAHMGVLMRVPVPMPPVQPGILLLALAFAALPPAIWHKFDAEVKRRRHNYLVRCRRAGTEPTDKHLEKLFGASKSKELTEVAKYNDVYGKWLVRLVGNPNAEEIARAKADKAVETLKRNREAARKAMAAKRARLKAKPAAGGDAGG
jgi:hypothetical protein